MVRKNIILCGFMGSGKSTIGNLLSKKMGMSFVDMDKYIEKRDKLRRTYYKTYTGREMGNANNYTICFDTGKISIPTCVDIIMKILEQE